MKNKQLLKASTSKAEVLEINTDISVASTTNEVITDSSRQDYIVEISPLGVFTYDAVNGYSGMASQLVWKGRLQQQILINRNGHQLIASNQRQTQATITTNSQSDQRIKNANWSSAIWFWLAVAAGIFLAWITLISRLRKKFCQKREMTSLRTPPNS